MTTGMIDLKINSGLKTAIEHIPTPVLAVPYAEPRFANTIAEAIPIYAKKAACSYPSTAPIIVE